VVARIVWRNYQANIWRIPTDRKETVPLTALVAAIVLGALLTITLVIAPGVFLISILAVGMLVVALILCRPLRGYPRRVR
jgi:uncharacterized transporter YbjL